MSAKLNANGLPAFGQIEGPAIVTIAGDHHEIGIGPLRRSQQPGPRHRIAAPIIEIIGQTRLCRRNTLTRIILVTIWCILGKPVERLFRRRVISHIGARSEHAPNGIIACKTAR